MENNKKLKVATVLGTRPEIIRLSQVLPKMDENFDHIVVFTRQSYDYELSDIFFQEFSLRKPDYILDVKAQTLGGQISNIISQTEKVLLKEQPDALLVLGDTNSSLCAIIAKRLKIPIFHMEAGNRCFDWQVPEEINRRIVDHISDYNLAYTEHARRYLIQEGIHPSTIFVTGSPLAEVFHYFADRINASTIIKDLKLVPEKYFVVSIHREENVDKQENLKELFSSLGYLADNYKLPVVVSLHPRTKRKVEDLKISIHSKIVLKKPFGYFDYNKLQKHAFCALSDSGTIQEESAILGFKAVQLRTSTERPEAFDTGSIVLTGFNKNTIINTVELVVRQAKRKEPILAPNDYKDANVSTKVVKLIMGFAGIRKYHKQ